MKISNYLSLISLALAIVLIILKLQSDIRTYLAVSDLLAESDISPQIVANGIRNILFYLTPVLLSLVLSIMGMVRRNNYRTIALALNILTVIYHIIPVGIVAPLLLS